MDRAFTKLSEYRKTTFLAFPSLAYLICYHLVVGKTTLLRQMSQQTNYFRIATKIAKAYQYQLWLQEIMIR